MGKVVVKVGGQTFQLACQDGEEQRLQSLASYVDGKMTDLAATLGQVGDTRLLLMTALLITDEMMEARDRRDQNGRDSAVLPRGSLSGEAGLGDGADKMVANLIKRIEDIAARLDKA